MTTACPKCGDKIEDGVFHGCGIGSLRAPWLLDEIAEMQTKQKMQLDEMTRIRELLEKQAEGIGVDTSISGRETAMLAPCPASVSTRPRRHKTGSPANDLPQT